MFQSANVQADATEANTSNLENVPSQRDKRGKIYNPTFSQGSGDTQEPEPEAGLFIKTLHVHTVVQVEAQSRAESTSKTGNPAQ